jgi:isoleucyl-tRNA synthetase
MEYRPIPTQVDLPALDHEVLKFWRDRDIFAKSLARTAGSENWVFYEGPPTANGMPGIHHVEARVFKDVFPRYRTMKGYYVPRRAGWDCHGLPVEIAVEKELGFASKTDIDAYGVAQFNARCRESVMRYVGAFEEMTERMGFWVDFSEAYRTMDASYIESVWWSLKQIWDRGLLVQDYRVAPYCPRCGTALSDHELAMGYETVVDPSVYVRFPLTSGPLASEAALLVWTTTPWTLVSNTAVAVHPDATYVVAEAPDRSERLVVAQPLLESALGTDWQVVGSFRGKDMERWAYQRPFALVDIPNAHFVVLDDYVTTDDGTGLVHQAPAFGADDLRVARAYGLPVLNPIRPDGLFAPHVPLIGGQFFKHADTALVKDLESRGLLVKHQPYEHAYPHCWRCHTPLIYYAQPSWYIRTTAIKDALLRENERTNWFPEHIKWGRYGDWLQNNVDWALSRNRYWGTPLPVWQCEQAHLVCVESLAELSRYAGQDLSGLDPHRPYVDDVTFACPECGGSMQRVPEVIDVWYDSGAMPFAQLAYPYAPGSVEEFEKTYPAQFICEGLDQTRGWFYSLMAVGTLVFDRSSYENVLCLGLILAEDGRRMSKHLGNVIEPMPLMDQHGADAVRWFMAASGSPWLPRRVGQTGIQEVVRKVLLTYWNTAAFLALYGRTSRWTPAAGAPAPQDRPLLDRWVLSELQRVVAQADEAYAGFDAPRVGSLIATFVDDLSNWYVRRSRRRFWDGDSAALATLHECLDVVTRLAAPLVPFITERVWQDLTRAVNPEAPESVHLASFPAADPSLRDARLGEQMALVRRIVELGRAARAESRVRTRQPLARALVAAPDFEALPEELQVQVRDELNVGALAPLEAVAGELVDYQVKVNFRSLGRRFGKDTPRVASAVSAADASAVAASLRTDGSVSVAVDGLGEISLGSDDVTVTETPREGWAVASDPGETVALDLTLTSELVRAGLAREVVRLVQEARKARGFDVSERVELAWSAGGELAEAVREHQASIADEVLAVRVTDDLTALAEEPEHVDADLGLTFRLRRV